MVEPPPELPRFGDDTGWGRTANGDKACSLRFIMPETADGDGCSSFAFVLPVQPGVGGQPRQYDPDRTRWIDDARRGSNLAMAILRNLRTGVVFAASFAPLTRHVGG